MQNTSESVERKPLHEEVAERLRQMITDGRLAPGEKLNERVLAQQLAVSRTPLREAIKGLAAERLVALLPHRGAVVARLERDTVVHLFELMGALEGLSGELAAKRCDSDTLNEIRALHFEMLAAHARQELALYYQLNKQIHWMINRAAANPELSESYDAVNSRIQALRFRSNFNQDKWDHAVQEHGAMLQALSQRDGARLRNILETHLANKRDAVLEQFPSEALH